MFIAWDECITMDSPIFTIENTCLHRVLCTLLIVKNTHKINNDFNDICARAHTQYIGKIK